MAKNRVRYENALSAGHAFSWDQRWEEAIEQFTIAVNESPQEPTAYAGLAMAYSELNRLPKALQNYRLAAKYSQGDVLYLNHVAELQEKLGQFSESSKTYMAIGETQLRQRTLDKALDSWHNAIRLQPDVMPAHQRLAAVYKKQGKNSSAVRQYLEIARILQKNGEKQKALHTCYMALELDPRNADAQTAIELVKRGEAIFSDDSNREALASSSSDDIDNVHHNLFTPIDEAREKAAETLAMQMFGDEDEDILLDASSAAKMQQIALISQALDFQTRKQYDQAINAYEQVIKLGNASAAAHFNLGLLYQDTMRFSEAMQQFEEATKDPVFLLGGHFAIGQCYRANEDIKSALVSFLNALQSVEMTAVSQDKTAQLSGKYNSIRESVNLLDISTCTKMANAYVEFLSQEGWFERAKETRTRLNDMAGAGEIMTIPDMLAIGSEHVLESLYFSQKYADEGLINSALEEIYRAILHSPEYLPAHEQMAELILRQERSRVASQKFSKIGDTYRVRGDMKNAIRNYEKSISVSPLDVDARFHLIEILKEHGYIDKCLEQYMGIGEAYYQLAQINKTKEVYEIALPLTNQGSPELKWRTRVLKAIADIDIQRFDWKHALGTYVELRRQEPGNHEIAATLVDLLYKVGQPDHALRELDRFLVQMIQSRQADKVESTLKQMVRRRPADGALSGRLVRMYLQKKDRKKAIEVLDQLGDAQLEVGEKKNALETIEQLLKLKPPNSEAYVQLTKRLREELA